MAKSHIKVTKEELKTQYSFSGRTTGVMLRKRRGGGNTSCEHRGLRQKFSPIFKGKKRWKCGYKYTTQDGIPIPGV